MSSTSHIITSLTAAELGVTLDKTNRIRVQQAASANAFCGQNGEQLRSLLDLAHVHEATEATLYKVSGNTPETKALLDTFANMLDHAKLQVRQYDTDKQNLAEQYSLAKKTLLDSLKLLFTPDFNTTTPRSSYSDAIKNQQNEQRRIRKEIEALNQTAEKTAKQLLNIRNQINDATISTLGYKGLAGIPTM